jgi:hypothetical protein
MENRLSHELVELRDVLLPGEIVRERIHDILVEHRTFRGQRVDLFPINFPRNSVDQKRILDSVELREHRILFEFFRMQDSHVSVNEKIELGDSVNVEMLMDEEHLQLMELERVLQCMNEDFHHV